jgi:hypothetical protein
MSSTSTNPETNLQLTPEQQALALVIKQADNSRILAVFETVLSNLPEDRKLPTPVQANILALADSNPDTALKFIIGLQNAGISKGLGFEDRGGKIQEVLSLVQEGKIPSDPKVIGDIIDLCSFDSDTQPESVALLMKKGLSISKIRALQDAGRSIDVQAKNTYAEKLTNRLDDDIDLMSRVVLVCRKLADESTYNKTHDDMYQRLARLADTMDDKEFKQFMNNFSADKKPLTTDERDLAFATRLL